MADDYSDYDIERLEELYDELSGKLHDMDSDSPGFEELQDEVFAIEDELQFRFDGCPRPDDDDDVDEYVGFAFNDGISLKNLQDLLNGPEGDEIRRRL